MDRLLGLTLGLAASGMVVGATTANATLLTGKTLDANTYYSDTSGASGSSTPVTATAPGSVVLPNVYATISYTDRTITLAETVPNSSVSFFDVNLLTGAPLTFNGVVFRGETPLGLTGVTLDPSSSFTPTGLGFTGDEVDLNLAGQSISAGQKIVLDLAPVPEPASWALMMLGVGGIGALARRRALLT